MNEEKLIEERKKNVVRFFKTSQIWVILLLIVLVGVGVYIRSLPMQDHNSGVAGNQPGLWNVATNNWTLGPDLDPWLFTRYAKTIVENNGSLPKQDIFRNVPLGFDTTTELQMVSYFIVFTYNIVNMFGSYPIEFAAALMPVIFFGLTIISFFLFVREVFIRKEEKKLSANLIALISTAFMIVIPVFLSRTVAGIPEKESVGFFFMFLAFYLFLKAWKFEKNYLAITFGVLAGISTALMGLTWGGVEYIYVTVAVASLGAFIINKVKTKEFAVYSSWLFVSLIVTLVFTNRFSIKGFLTSLDSGLAFLVFFVLFVHLIAEKFSLYKKDFMKKVKLPSNLISIIISVILGVILVSIAMGPSVIIEKLTALNQIMFRPITGRWSTTVAENNQPHFIEWVGSFGPSLKNIPILFWLGVIGSILLFKKALNHLKEKDAWILVLTYVLLFAGLVFSRYSDSTIFNGENFISKLFYYASALIFIGSLVYYYIKYDKVQDKAFEKIDFEYLFLLVLFILCLFTARSAVRLIMVLGPIIPIFVGFLIIYSFEGFRKTKDETWKVVLGAAVLLILILSMFSFYSFYNSIKTESYNYVPSYYNQQWQEAMKWVDTNTSSDAVFAHWWDYGYWVQSIGNRATVLDGGNSITYWNYLMGRLVLTGDNQKDSLEFLYNHNTTHLLIDSSDIGKYGAFSSIGSDKNYDRYSWFGTFLLDESQTQETSNETLLVYTGGIALDEDLIINDSGKEILLPGQAAGVGAIVLPYMKTSNQTQFGQPYVVMVYQGKQYKQNLRYLSVDKKFIDFNSGIEGCAYIMTKVTQDGQRVGADPIGASIFISPRLMRGFFAQKYLLNDPFKKFPNFKIVHSEPNLIISSLNSQGMNLPEFVYFQGIQGPIKIWSVEYTGNEKIKQEYQDKDATLYLDWQL
ncbi:MAG: STT3 domain-containing protein [Candidatus Pacearchaeota archaeon]|jgi:asparagine N-glycosylation enzyme membrane subunit Stt3